MRQMVSTHFTVNLKKERKGKKGYVPDAILEQLTSGVIARPKAIHR